ncbi:MAG: CHAP domain-containing protein [Archangium sp.]|nr:CHAP domain-containing protein [Archangium sp.]
MKLAVPHLPDDCTGLVRAVYEDSGIELMGAGVRGDNGVTAMWRLAFERSALHTHAPAPGDLVFFRETYDRNRNGRRDDGLTHVGVVETIDGRGTVTFVHRSGTGVTRAKLDLGSPLDKKRNDFLRPARRGQPALLTGELFVTFASAERLGAALVTSMSRRKATNPD